MAIEAKLPDGTTLSFPEGTPDDVIDKAVKGYVGETQQRSFAESAYLGLREPIDILASRLEPQFISNLGKSLGMPTASEATREADVMRVSANPLGRAVGNIAGTALTLPYRAVLAPSTIAQAAAGGAAAGALMSRAEDATGIAADAIPGAVFGAALKPVADVFSNVIAPKAGEQLRTLYREGINPTIGMIAGETGNILGTGLRKAEEALTSLPGLGDLIQYARDSVGKEFEKSALNRASMTIGKVVPKELSGEQAVGWVKGQLQRAYNSLVPNLEFQITSDLGQKAKQIFDDLAIPSSKKGLAEDWAAIVKDNILDLADDLGFIKGKNLQDALSRIGKTSDSFIKSADPFERRLGIGAAKLRQVWMDALAEQNPSQAAALKQINSGWSLQAVLKKAASGSGGRITPQSLDRAVTAFGKGERRGPLVDLVRAGRAIPSTTPDSGTFTRALRNTAAVGGFAAAGQGIANALGYDIELTPQQAAAVALVAAPYTPQGRKAIAAILGRQPSKLMRGLGIVPRAALAPAVVSGAVLPNRGQ